MASVLVRTMRRVIHDEIKSRSIRNLSGTQLGQAIFPTSLLQAKPYGASGVSPRQPNDHYLGNQQHLFKECIVLFINAIMKNKFSKYKQVFDEALLGLFLSRLKIICLAHRLELQQHEINYLESKDLIEHIIEMPSRNPIMFLNTVQEYFNVQFDSEFIRLYRQDKYYILNKSKPMSINDFKEDGVLMKVDTYWSIKEHAYFILARKIAFNTRLRKQKDQNLRSSRPSLARVFNRPGNRSNHNDYQDTERSFRQTDRDIETYRNNYHQKPSMQNKRQSSLMVNKEKNQETHRNFQNLGNNKSFERNASMRSDGTEVFRQSFTSGGYSNIIDLSKINRRQTLKLSKAGEIILPSGLYKLQTNAQTYQQNVNNTIFQPFYDMPNVDVINEWVIVLESLLKDVFSVQGCEQVLLEALIYQFMMTFFIESD